MLENLRRPPNNFLTSFWQYSYFYQCSHLSLSITVCFKKSFRINHMVPYIVEKSAWICPHKIYPPKKRIIIFSKKPNGKKYSFYFISFIYNFGVGSRFDRANKADKIFNWTKSAQRSILVQQTSWTSNG